MERHAQHHGFLPTHEICHNRETETLGTSLEEAALLLEAGLSPFSTDLPKRVMGN